MNNYFIKMFISIKKFLRNIFSFNKPTNIIHFGSGSLILPVRQIDGEEHILRAQNLQLLHLQKLKIVKNGISI